MCFLASLAHDYKDLRRSVRVPILVETLLCESAARQVLVGCDLIVENRANGPADLFLTHPGDVEGRLATEDWFNTERPAPDERVVLVQQIYGKYWGLNVEERTLHFVNPVECPVGGHALGPPANALSFRPPRVLPRCPELAPAYVLPEAPYFGTYPLKRFPEAPDGGRPFSAFCFNLPPRSQVFFRLTAVLAGDAYTRLVDRPGGTTFDVIGPDQVLRRLDRDLTGHTGVAQPFEDFYGDLRAGHVEPEHYHVIIAQPDDANPQKRHNRLVGCRPTSPAVRELYILHDGARDRALWFDAVSADFRIILQYQDRPGHPLTRQDFFKRLPPTFAAHGAT